MTYNQRAYIETCLRSILDQMVDADVRVLVGDDGSTDGTGDSIRALVAEYGPRLVHLRRERNLGPFANLLDLLLRAEGEFIARVDGDDYWLPGKLARQLAYLRRYPDCSAVYTSALTVDERGRALGVFNDLGDAKLDLATLLRRGNALNNSSVLYRACHGTGWQAGEQIDYQIHLWLARHGWLGHIGEPLAGYRVNTQGSLVLSANERVRTLYWQAIQSVPRALVRDADYARGITDFLRRVCLRAARTRDWSLLRRWAGVVYAISPYGALRTSLLLAANLVRTLGRLVLAHLGRALGRATGRRVPAVLYPH
ncbi:glycosyltransferase [Luteimonas sp. WGS1318]|uniref:glycosyltransferase n=1 Tax=Luteimonas sp. WGS1318 TaxID=3366815 RepID=UPI00372D63F7